jgi:hypothetical protein
MGNGDDNTNVDLARKGMVSFDEDEGSRPKQGRKWQKEWQ